MLSNSFKTVGLIILGFIIILMFLNFLKLSDSNFIVSDSRASSDTINKVIVDNKLRLASLTAVDIAIKDKILENENLKTIKLPAKELVRVDSPVFLGKFDNVDYQFRINVPNHERDLLEGCAYTSVDGSDLIIFKDSSDFLLFLNKH